jgi:hypothetical protein
MREIRLSGSVEGVVSNHDPYSDCFAEGGEFLLYALECCAEI